MHASFHYNRDIIHIYVPVLLARYRLGIQDYFCMVAGFLYSICMIDAKYTLRS